MCWGCIQNVGVLRMVSASGCVFPYTRHLIPHIVFLHPGIFHCWNLPKIHVLGVTLQRTSISSRESSKNTPICQSHITIRYFSCISRWNWSIDILIFVYRGKCETRKKYCTKVRVNPNSTHGYQVWIRSLWDWNPGIGENQVLSPLYQPCSRHYTLSYLYATETTLCTDCCEPLLQQIYSGLVASCYRNWVTCWLFWATR